MKKFDYEEAEISDDGDLVLIGPNPRTAKQTFESWMAGVDKAVLKKAFVSVHDLADMPFRDWYEDGITPSQAARLTLAEEGF